MDGGERPRRKLRLGDLLVQSGLISEGQLQLALDEQKRSGAKLGRAVVDMGFVSEQKLLEALSRQLDIPYVDLRQFKFNEKLVLRLPEAMARRFRAILLVEEGDGLLVGMSDPLDLYALDELSRLLRQPLKPAVVRESELLDNLDRFYRQIGRAHV